jgi:rRNA large subunit m3Psi methyltransferase RlmH
MAVRDMLISMLHLTVWAQGPTPRGPWKELQADYKRFLGSYCQITEKFYKSEGEMLANWPEGGPILMLDAGGASLSSEAWALKVGRYVDAGDKLHLLLGGPDGWGAEAKERARDKLALSAMTFPHDAALTLFYEQLFRAMTIIQGRAYHR